MKRKNPKVRIAIEEDQPIGLTSREKRARNRHLSYARLGSHEGKVNTRLLPKKGKREKKATLRGSWRCNFSGK